MSEESKEHDMSMWKEYLVKKGGVSEPVHEFQRRMKRLGLSEDVDITQKDSFSQRKTGT